MSLPSTQRLLRDVRQSVNKEIPNNKQGETSAKSPTYHCTITERPNCTHFPHTTQENLALRQKLMIILLLTLQHQDTTSDSSLEKDINTHHLNDIDHLTQPEQRTGQIEKDHISVKQTNEVFYIVDRAADVTQGHSKDHPNEWSIQVIHELLSGTGHLTTLQDMYNTIMGEDRSTLSRPILQCEDYTILDSEVETDCLFVTFIQTIYLLQEEDPTNLPKLVSNLREKFHSFINEAITNHDSDETNTPLYTIIRKIVSEHGKSVLDFTDRLWTTEPSPAPSVGSLEIHALSSIMNCNVLDVDAKNRQGLGNRNLQRSDNRNPPT
jgi:hypothetical protein